MSAADTAPIEAGNLFNVNGLVAVITGGGSGQLKLFQILLLFGSLCELETRHF